MALLDTIKDGLTKILPSKSSGPTTSLSGGIGNGNGHGIVPYKDDMIVPKPTIVFHALQIFFNFLAMACFAGVAAFQGKWHVGPSGLTGFTLFVTIIGMFYSLFMLLVPVIYERYDKLIRLARAFREVRVGFILTGTGTTVSLLIAFIDTISAWTQPGCKDADKDPHADLGDDFKKGLGGFCSTKKAGAIFLWLVFVAWAASLGFLILQWRQGKLFSGPQDLPFNPPQGDGEYPLEEDEESSYHVVPPVNHGQETSETSTYPSHPNPFSDSNRYVSSSNPAYAPRQSMDAYGAFSDPAPSGYGGGPASPGTRPPAIPEQDFGPKVSRTMQYADPYSQVRANLGGNNASGPPSPGGVPPSYDSGYTGYR